jgi:sugar transferase (PEP-CTERM/EpsH1 system associated)
MSPGAAEWIGAQGMSGTVIAREPGREPAAGRPLRVVHVVNALELAGMEFGVIKVANRLDPERVRAGIVCLTYQAATTRTVTAPHVRVVALGVDPRRNWRLILSLARVFRSERAQVVHTHNWQTYLYAVLGARLAGVPVVVHGEHGRDTQASAGLRLLLKRAAAPLVTRFVAVSQHLGSEFIHDWRIAPERLTVIPNGVDLDTFRLDTPAEDLRRSLGLTSEHRVISNVGGLRKVKDHPTLIRAFARVHAGHPETRLVIVGSDRGPGLKEELVGLADSLHVTPAVLFAGVRHDIAAVLALTDVYVNSSTFEGMSNTILEAMAMGRPVVATAVGGNAELVVEGETGFLTPAGDDARMAERIEALLADDRLRAAMGRAARTRIERHHRMERMVSTYSDLYEETWERHQLRLRAPLGEWGKRALARAAVLSVVPTITRRLRPSTLTILTYHRVLPLHQASAYPLPGMVMPRDSFEAQIARLARHYHVLPLPEALERLRAHTLPPRAVVVTFDDGYRDNYEHAWPILRRFGLTATFFVVTDILDRTERLWWDEANDAARRLRNGRFEHLPRFVQDALAEGRGRDPAIAGLRLVEALNRASRPERLQALDVLRVATGVGARDEHGLMMSWAEAREMARSGMTFGTHSRTHAFLDELTHDEVRREIAGSPERIAEMLDAPAPWLAWPRGRVMADSHELLRETGIQAAFSTEPGQNGPDADFAALRRIDAGYFRLNIGFDAAVFDTEMTGAPKHFRRH